MPGGMAVRCSTCRSSVLATIATPSVRPVSRIVSSISEITRNGAAKDGLSTHRAGGAVVIVDARDDGLRRVPADPQLRHGQREGGEAVTVGDLGGRVSADAQFYLGSDDGQRGVPSHIALRHIPIRDATGAGQFGRFHHPNPNLGHIACHIPAVDHHVHTAKRPPN